MGAGHLSEAKIVVSWCNNAESWTAAVRDRRIESRELITDPAPWSFRTPASWLELFRKHGLRPLQLREPLHPRTHRPAAVIFIADVTE